MAPATTSCIDKEAVLKYFGQLTKCPIFDTLSHFNFSTCMYVDGYIQEHASMVTTEISQVPLDGVKALLDSAKYVFSFASIEFHCANVFVLGGPAHCRYLIWISHLQ